ncbi:MAG: 5'-methylthioadenosine/S-adenosylhomocysteine nucleosidase [Gammaproteobacteria bacterium]|nr:5'-methylthioadenosine/S-adenosylhomocysteine nucleosidase [Gammaproteobacteria bacterium]
MENMRRAIFITALPVEFDAVCEHLSDIKENKHDAGTIYKEGVFYSLSGRNWRVGVIQTGQGNPQAALETERAIAHFNPSHAVFTGVAGGLKDVKLGDVIVADKIYYYESGKAEQQYKTRPESSEPAYAMLQHARMLVGYTDWVKRIRGDKEKSKHRVFVGPIASGEKVIASTDSPYYLLLKQNFSDALAIEEEGFGFLRAAHANPQVQALVIRGISDLIDGKSEAEKSGSQENASRTAAAFAFEVLAGIRPKADADVKQNDSLFDADRCKQLSTLASQLYPRGPEDQHVWSRAGGSIAKLTLSSTGEANWYAAIQILKQGGGGSISFKSLILIMHDDYPHNDRVMHIMTLFNLPKRTLLD